MCPAISPIQRINVYSCLYRCRGSNTIIQLGQTGTWPITHIMHAMKDLSALVSLFQQCLGPFGFIAVGDSDCLPEVHPSNTHVSVRQGDGHVY